MTAGLKTSTCGLPNCDAKHKGFMQGSNVFEDESALHGQFQKRKKLRLLKSCFFFNQKIISAENSNCLGILPGLARYSGRSGIVVTIGACNSGVDLTQLR